MTNPSNERRKYLRIYRHYIMAYHEKGKSIIKKHVSQVNNVSKGGMSFSSTHPLNQGVHVIIDLKTPFIADPIHLEGVVLECKEKIPEMVYDVRVQFHELSEDASLGLDKIENYGKDKEV